MSKGEPAPGSGRSKRSDINKNEIGVAMRLDVDREIQDSTQNLYSENLVILLGGYPPPFTYTC